MSDLVVNLSDPADVADALAILTAIHSGGWPDLVASAVDAEPTTPPWEGPDEIDRSGRSQPANAGVRGSSTGATQSDSKPVDDDPWASGAKMPETPRAAASAPATSNPADAPASADDDNPWS